MEQPGMLFLGFIGLCFLASIISGVVLYRPFMRRLPYGTLRIEKRRRYWLDLHNLAGITLMAWMIVVGVTGVVNTLSQQIADHWMRTELAAMIAPWRNAPVPTQVVPLQDVVQTVLAAFPGMAVATVAMPGSMFAGGHHYDVFLSGADPLTSKLIKPVMVDAQTGRITEARDLPWYAQALFISKPLHFGDYGGWPLKVLWAVLDLMTIGVLLSGLYLWISRLAGIRNPAIGPADEP
jgi:uncharacterized iron-regulated membrane protein